MKTSETPHGSHLSVGQQHTIHPWPRALPSRRGLGPTKDSRRSESPAARSALASGLAAIIRVIGGDDDDSEDDYAVLEHAGIAGARPRPGLGGPGTVARAPLPHLRP